VTAQVAILTGSAAAVLLFFIDDRRGNKQKMIWYTGKRVWKPAFS
jgi:hypothetical protein